MKALIRQKNVNSLAAPVPVFTRRDVKMPAIKGKAIAVVGTRRTSGCLTTERDSTAAPFVGSAEAAACCTSGRNRSTSLAVPSRARVCLRSTCKDSRRSPAQLCRHSPRVQDIMATRHEIESLRIWPVGLGVSMK